MRHIDAYHQRGGAADLRAWGLKVAAIAEIGGGARVLGVLDFAIICADCDNIASSVTRHIYPALRASCVSTCTFVPVKQVN